MINQDFKNRPQPDADAEPTLRAKALQGLCLVLTFVVIFLGSLLWS